MLAERWTFCFIGGLALIRWGEPRLTGDVDVSLFTGFGNEEAIVARLLSHYSPRLPDAARFALRHRTLLLVSAEGIPMDIGLTALPFERDVIGRASEFDFLPDVRLRTCSAEDLIVLKAFADSGQDRIDIAGVIRRRKASLDWKLIESNLTPLVELKGEPEILVNLRRLQESLC